MQADGEMVRRSVQAATVHGMTVATAAMALQCSHCADIAIALPLPLVQCPSVLGRQRQAPHSLCDAWPSMEGGDQRGGDRVQQ
jgi:hypothetical protein